MTPRTVLIGLAVILIPFYCCGAVFVAIIIRLNSTQPVAPTVVTQAPTQTATVDPQLTTTAIALAQTATAISLPPTPTALDLNGSSPYNPANLTPNANGDGSTPIYIAAQATDIVGAATPIGLIPDCADFNGTTSQSIRAIVPPGSAGSARIYCRVITDKYQIGVASVLARGVQLAVDVFALNGGSSVTRFNNPIYVCLQGTGVFIFLDANLSPRTPTQLNSVSDSGYQCASVSNAGTVVLVNQ